MAWGDLYYQQAIIWQARMGDCPEARTYFALHREYNEWVEREKRKAEHSKPNP